MRVEPGMDVPTIAANEATLLLSAYYGGKIRAALAIVAGAANVIFLRAYYRARRVLGEMKEKK